ncbi:DUF421 domain-containing protein [Planococcus salinus]|nr:YetF domain-containing protein [Planococcus salinus]
MFDLVIFDNWNKLIRIFLMTLLIYPFLIVLLRISGKRSLAKVNIFDFIISVALGAAFASILLTRSITFADGALLLFLLIFFQFIISKLEVHSTVFAKLIKATPQFLYVDGKFNENIMKRNRLGMDDLNGAVRKEGMASYEQVEAVVLEGDGTLSVIEKGNYTSKEALDGVEGKEN